MKKKGDANTKYFQIMANVRKKINFMTALHTENGVHTSQSKKQDIVYQHFSKQLGSNAPRGLRLNFEKLGWTPQGLEHLDVPFTE